MIFDSNKEAYLNKVFQLFSKSLRESGPYASASYTLIGAILLLGMAGYFLDRWLNTTPWLFLIGLLLGLVIGFYEMAKVVLKK